MDSEKPINDKRPCDNAQNESPEESKRRESEISQVSASVKSQSQKPHGHYEITCKTQKNWWDKIKPFAELGGLGLLAAYTVFAGCQVKIGNRTLKEIHDQVTLQRLVTEPKVVLNMLAVHHSGQRMWAIVRVQNNGGTVAEFISVAAKLEFRTSKPSNPRDYQFTDKDFGDTDPSILRPYTSAKDVADIQVYLDQSPPDVTSQRFYVWGKISFRDMAGLKPFDVSFCRSTNRNAVLNAPEWGQPGQGYSGPWREDCNQAIDAHQ